jgi:LacI family transcriptional regulator
VKKTPTVYDVAARAGVSTATVSRVFQGPSQVRGLTREKVMAAVRELGYVPSASARGLAERRTGVLGLFVPGLDEVEDAEDVAIAHGEPVTVVYDIPDPRDVAPTNLYFDEVLRGCESEARRRDFTLMLGTSSDRELERRLNDIAGRVDGVGVLAQNVPADLLEHVARRVPVVVIAGPRRDDAFDHVSVTNTEGMQALTDHLIDGHGVGRLAYVGGPEGSPDDAERHEGVVAALRSHGLDPELMPVWRAGFSRVRARAVASEIAGHELPEAIVCGNDQMALGVLEVFGQLGIRVPDDVIVTGFDGIEFGRQSAPRLTTVRQPMYDLGRAAIRAMLSRIDQPGQPQIVERLPVRVLLRESCEGPEGPKGSARPAG